jgi:hypothetical protein
MAVKKQAKKPARKPAQEAVQPQPQRPVQEQEMHNPMDDAPRPIVPARAARITPQVALEALLLSWLCLRDFAMWPFVQGVDTDAPLALVDLSEVENTVRQMNTMRDAALHFAQQIAGKNDPAAVVRDAIAKVRRDHAPVFSMTVPSIPSAF